MLVHVKPRARRGVTLPLSALIDIVFLLLIYFLLTTNYMVDEAIDLKLPQARAGAPQLEQQITIYVDQEGRIFVGRAEVPFERLYAHLKTMIDDRAAAQVVIKADRRVVLNQAVRVMDVAKAAGAAQLFLATEQEL